MRFWIAIVCATLLLPIANATSALYCDTASIQNIIAIGGGALMVLVIAMALAYMGGKSLHEPRFTEWAKTEGMQVPISVLLIILSIWLVSLQCGMGIGEFAGWAGLQVPSSLQLSPSDGVYDASVKYLSWGAEQTLIGITAIRAQMGAYNIRATVNAFETVGGISAAGYSHSPNSGDYTLSGVLGTLLNLNTMFLLSIYFQYYSLQLFASGPLLMSLLPIGFLLRSVPFMRGVGGAIAAIGIAFYLFYPLMLAIFSIALPPIFVNNDGSSMTGMTLGQIQDYEMGLEGSWITYLNSTPSARYALGDLFKLTLFNFLRAIFFPTAGLIAIVALTKDLSKLFGEEVDATKLVQML